MTTGVRRLTRAQIAEFIPSERGVRAFEGLQETLESTEQTTQELAADTGGEGMYGSATETVQLTVSANGRITEAHTFTLVSDNVSEGSANLYYTNARARAALSNGTGITYDTKSGIISLTSVAGVAGTHASPTSITVDGTGRITAIS